MGDWMQGEDVVYIILLSQLVVLLHHYSEADVLAVDEFCAWSLKMRSALEP